MSRLDTGKDRRRGHAERPLAASRGGAAARWWGLACVALLGACTAPTDCSLEPTRCLPPAYSVASSAPQRANPAGIGQARPATSVQVPSARAPAVVADRPPPRPGVRPGNPNNLLAPTDAFAARTREGARGLPAVRADRPAAPAVQDGDQLALVRRTLASALAGLRAHDLEQIKPWVTKRYVGQFDEIRAQYLDRFWRHADKVAAALSSPSPNLRVDSVPDGRLQAVLTTAEGTELKPLMAFEDGIWKIDRL